MFVTTRTERDAKHKKIIDNNKLLKPNHTKQFKFLYFGL